MEKPLYQPNKKIEWRGGFDSKSWWKRTPILPNKKELPTVGPPPKKNGKMKVLNHMEEILHHLGCTKPCKSWDKLPINWCRISEPVNGMGCYNPEKWRKNRGISHQKGASSAAASASAIAEWLAASDVARWDALGCLRFFSNGFSYDSSMWFQPFCLETYAPSRKTIKYVVLMFETSYSDVNSN